MTARRTSRGALRGNAIALAGFALATVALLSAVSVSSAAEITLNATSVGYIRRVPGATCRHFPTVGHLTGSQGNGLLHVDNNSYFVFDLSAISGTITGARFKVYTSDERADVPEGGYWSSSPSEQLRLHAVATDPGTLSNFSTTQYNVGSSQFNQLNSMFTDLADGALFGSTVITESAAEVQPGAVPGQPGGKIWDIALGNAALTSLNATSSLWALGGSLAETAVPISTTTELLFGGSVPFSPTPGRATPIPQLVLSVAPGLAADFDADNDVDGRDFLLWQRGFGLGGQVNNNQGDATGNGSVGGEDLAVWQGQFGTSGAPSSATAVPEPSIAAMVSLVAAVSILRTRARSHRIH